MEIAEKRWKETDKILRQFQRAYKVENRYFKNDLLDFFRGLSITPSGLNKSITGHERDGLNKLIRDNQKTIASNDYLAYRVNTRKKNMSYAEYIGLVLLILYWIFLQSIYDMLKSVFEQVSLDALRQAEEEIGRKPRKPFSLSWKKIEPFLTVKATGQSLLAYFGLLAVTASQEMAYLFAQLLNPNTREVSQIDSLLDKQGNRIINIHDGKESGAVAEQTHKLWHDIYVEPYKDENIQVRFIAEVDNVTTKMCRGMDNMLFYINDWNRYYRWSELDKKDVLYTTFGLIQGDNLPPIENHFHWCRSTITYMIDTPRQDIDRILHPENMAE